jgi:hypothetical protein
MAGQGGRCVGQNAECVCGDGDDGRGGGGIMGVDAADLCCLVIWHTPLQDLSWEVAGGGGSVSNRGGVVRKGGWERGVTGSKG